MLLQHKNKIKAKKKRKECLGGVLATEEHHGGQTQNKQTAGRWKRITAKIQTSANVHVHFPTWKPFEMGLNVVVCRKGKGTIL